MENLQRFISSLLNEAKTTSVKLTELATKYNIFFHGLTIMNLKVDGKTGVFAESMEINNGTAKSNYGMMFEGDMDAQNFFKDFGVKVLEANQYIRFKGGPHNVKGVELISPEITLGEYGRGQSFSNCTMEASKKLRLESYDDTNIELNNVKITAPEISIYSSSDWPTFTAKNSKIKANEFNIELYGRLYSQEFLPILENAGITPTFNSSKLSLEVTDPTKVGSFLNTTGDDLWDVKKINVTINVIFPELKRLKSKHLEFVLSKKGRNWQLDNFKESKY